jgi:peptidoglycan/xylan/chitin deacetylase (PgdA/CDA1 family)
MIPHRTPFFLPLLYPSLTWRISTDKPEIFLTFDDGPVNGPTEFVLETLAKASIPATFFCIGDNIVKHPDVFQKIISAGHTVGNHTFNHLNGWKTKTEEYVRNIQLLEDSLSAVNCQLSTLFRPPYGRITFPQIRALHQYKIVMWDVLSFDFNKNLSGEACLRNTLSVIRPGSIIVFHDSFKAEKNLTYALPRLINSLADRGFVFKALKA